MLFVASLLAFVAVASCAGSVQVIQDYNGKFRFAILGESGDALLTSVSSFDDQDSCVKAVAASVERGKSADNFKADPTTVFDSYYESTTFYKLELTDESGAVICESSNLESTTAVDDTKTQTVAVCASAPAVVRQDSTEVRIGKFEIFQDIVGQWRFRLKAGNGEIILASEAYTRKGSAYVGIRSVKKNSIAMANFKLEKSTADQPYFNLVAQNNEIVGTSEMYSSTSARLIGVESVMRNAALAPIVDLTYGKPTAGQAKYELFQEEFGDYSWRLLAADNTQVIVEGYSYDSKADAEAALDEFKTASTTMGNWVKFTETLGYSQRTRYIVQSTAGAYTAATALGFTPFAADMYLDTVRTAVLALEPVKVPVEKQWTERKGRFTIFCGEDANGDKTGKFYFHLQAANYEIILASQAYTAKASAKNGIDSVIENGADMAQFKELTSEDGKPYFTLKAKNNQVIGVSETYSSNSARQAGIDSIMRNIKNAEIVDNAQKCQAPPTYPDTCEIVYGIEVCEEASSTGNQEAREDGSAASSMIASVMIIVIAFVALF